MSLDQIEATLLKLPREERRRFSDWFYEHENQILDPGDDDEVSPQVMTEILHRRETALAHPEQLEAWGDTTDLRARLNEIRSQKSQARQS